MKRLRLLILALALIVCLAVPLLAQSDAGFLEGSGHERWACLHADHTFWAWTPYGGQGQYTLAVQWCENNGYTY